MNEAGADALVSKYQDSIWEEWKRVREQTGAFDLVAILRIHADESGSVQVLDRIHFLTHLRKTAGSDPDSIPDTIQGPAGVVHPVVPNRSAIWVIVLGHDDKGMCLRMTEARLVQGGVS